MSLARRVGTIVGPAGIPGPQGPAGSNGTLPTTTGDVIFNGSNVATVRGIGGNAITNSPADGQVPVFSVSTGKVSWATPTIGALVNDVTTIGTAATVNAIKNVPVSGSAPGTSQALVYTGSQYAAASVETVLHVDTFIAAAAGNATTGINNCLQAAATASQTQGACLRVVFGAKVYIVGPLKMIAATGVILDGCGENASFLQPTSACAGLPVLSLVNCAFCKVRNITVQVGPVTSTLSANAIVGATTLHVASGANFANGQKIGLKTAAQDFAEVVTVASGGGTTTLTLSGGLRNPYSSGDTVIGGALIAFQSLIDTTQSILFTPTSNKFENLTVGAIMLPVSFDAAGGTGGSSDQNNDNHTVTNLNLSYGTGVVAAVNVGHSQSLANTIRGGNITATYGVQCLTGGSFSMYDGEYSCTGSLLALGGVIGRPGVIAGVVQTDSAAMLVQARASDSMTGANLTFLGVSCFGPPASSAGKSIDVTGSAYQFSFTGGSLCIGGTPTSNTLFFKDIAGTTLSSQVSFTDVKLGVFGATADGVIIKSQGTTQWTAGTGGAFFETTLNGGQFLNMTSGASNNGLAAPYNVGQIYGYSVLQNQTTQSGSYTADSQPVIDHTILCDNSAGTVAISLPTPKRSGRQIQIIAKSNVATHSVTVTPASGTINNGASYTLNAGTGQTALFEWDAVATNWWVVSVTAASSSYTPPTGTGIPHITSGAQDSAAIHGTADQLFGANHAGTDATFFTLSGDASVSSGLITVNSITGSAGKVAIASTGANIQWAAGSVTPGLSQATPASDVATTNMVFTSQGPFASAVTNLQPGSFIFNTPAPISGSPTAKSSWQTGGTTYFSIAPNGAGGSCILTAAAQLNINTTNNFVCTSSGGGFVWAGLSNVFQNAGGTTFATINPGVTTQLLFGNAATTAVTISQTAAASVGTTPGAQGVPLGISGQAGQATTAVTGVGGIGAVAQLQGGTGGAASGATSATGGVGGFGIVAGGVGGGASGAGIDVGGVGGTAQLVGGNGGAATVGGTKTGGAGGNAVVSAGNAGAGGNAVGGNVSVSGGAGTGTGLAGSIQFNLGGVNTVTWGGQSGSVTTGVQYTAVSTALTTGTATLSTLALAAPMLTFTGTLTGAVTIDFGGHTGFWYLDFSAVTLGGFGVSVKNGTTTTVVTALLTTGKMLLSVACNGTNSLAAG